MYNLSWERLLFNNEYMNIFPELALSTHFNIKSLLPHMTFRMTHCDYLYLCAVLMHNFAFDDGADYLFIHDWVIYKQFAPTEIRFLLEVGDLDLLLLEDEGVSARIRLERAQCDFIMEQNTRKNIRLVAKFIEFFDIVMVEGVPTEKAIIGHLEVVRPRDAQRMEHSFSYIQSIPFL